MTFSLRIFRNSKAKETSDEYINSLQHCWRVYEEWEQPNLVKEIWIINY